MEDLTLSTFDCIIVGAGPAGSTALRQLAKLGVHAAALGKESFPRYKPCGGAISATTARQLDFPWEDLIDASSYHLELSCHGSHPLTLSTDRPFAHFVMRDRFDQRLLDAAIDAGGRFYPNRRVTHIEQSDDMVSIHTTQGVFRARYVIGADGANGVVARAIGLYHRFRGIAIEAEITPPPPILERYRDHVVLTYADPPWGYSWVFPKANRLSVGSGTFSQNRAPIKSSFQAFLSRMDLANYPMDIYGHPIPTGGSHQRLWVPRIVLAGDAAGLNDPLSGEGIAHAVTSGRIAAHHIYHALQTGETDFHRYEDEIRRHIIDDLVRAASIAQKMYTFPRLFFGCSPRVLQRLKVTSVL